MSVALKYPFRNAFLIAIICLGLQLALSITGSIPSIMIPFVSLLVVIPVGSLLRRAKETVKRTQDFESLVI